MYVMKGRGPGESLINRIVWIVYSLTRFVLYNFSYLLYVIGKGIT